MICFFQGAKVVIFLQKTVVAPQNNTFFGIYNVEITAYNVAETTFATFGVPLQPVF